MDHPLRLAWEGGGHPISVFDHIEMHLFVRSVVNGAPRQTSKSETMQTPCQLCRQYTWDHLHDTRSACSARVNVSGSMLTRHGMLKLPFPAGILLSSCCKYASNSDTPPLVPHLVLFRLRQYNHCDGHSAGDITTR